MARLNHTPYFLVICLTILTAKCNVSVRLDQGHRECLLKNEYRAYTCSPAQFSPSDAQRTYDERGMNVSLHLGPDEIREDVELSACDRRIFWDYALLGAEDWGGGEKFNLSLTQNLNCFFPVKKISFNAYENSPSAMQIWNGKLEAMDYGDGSRVRYRRLLNSVYSGAPCRKTIRKLQYYCVSVWDHKKAEQIYSTQRG